MKNHILKLKTPADLEFGSADESIVFNLMPEDELISKEEFAHKVVRYSCEKSIRRIDNYRTVGNLIDLLIQRKALKEISGEQVGRMINYFKVN